MTAIEETYQDVEQLIYKLTYAHIRKYGRDFDEALSDANMGFLAAYERFDHAKAQFITFCYYYVYWYLLNGHNKPHGSTEKKTQFNRSMKLDGAMLMAVVKDTGFDVGMFARDLSGDAQALIRLALDLPRVKHPVKLRRGLLRDLQHRLGWTAARCIETFKEIREALV